MKSEQPNVVRVAVPDDVTAIIAIYGHAVRTSVATFDLEDPPASYWNGKIASQKDGNHVLVIEDEHAVVGFAYSTPFRPRPAYSRTRETSVYLAPDRLGLGLGRMVYERLLSQLVADRMHVAIAVIAQPNPASVALHERMGFELVGTLHDVGRKFDRWIDTRWYELRLHSNEPRDNGVRARMDPCR
jgi:phosphinothricin acetyltransferase